MTIDELMIKNVDVLQRMKKRDSDDNFNRQCEKEFLEKLKKNLTKNNFDDILNVEIEKIKER